MCVWFYVLYLCVIDTAFVQWQVHSSLQKLFIPKTMVLPLLGHSGRTAVFYKVCDFFFFHLTTGMNKGQNIKGKN